MRSYIAVVHKEEGTSHGIDFPDFPGAVTAAETAEGVESAARELLAVCFEEWATEMRELPEPSDLDALRTSLDLAGAYAFLWVSGPPGKGRAVRVTITMDEHLLAAADAAAGAAGETRSGFLADAVRARIGSIGTYAGPHAVVQDSATGKLALEAPATPKGKRARLLRAGRSPLSRKG